MKEDNELFLEKKKQLKEWNDRNRHVLEIQGLARGVVYDMIMNNHQKSDIILVGELILDIGRRFD